MKSIKNFLNENAKFLTWFLVVLIVFGGIAAVENKENWWIIPVGILFVGAVTIIFINARFIVKLFFALFVTSTLSAYAFQIGTTAGNNSDSGAFWMGLMWLNFFLFISLSYMKETSQSRWTAIIITQTLSFLYFYVFNITVSFILTIIFGEILTILTFIVLYYFSLKNIVNIGSMPKQRISKKFINQIDKETKELNWKYKILEKQNSVILWGEYEDNIVSLLLIPIKMDQKFGVIGKKKQQLSYKGVAVNNWLNKLIYGSIPHWKLRGLTPLPVLCDLDGRNGKEIKTIGVKIADRKTLYPFIITPLKNNLLEKLLKTYYKTIPKISKKQLKALEGLGEKFEN